MIIFEFLRNFGANCTTEPSFFGFPTWYKYLYAFGKITPECTLSDGFNLKDIWLIVLALIDMAIYLAGIVSVVMIIWGGFRFITSQGSPDTIKEARNTILYAIIGLIVSISARAIIAVVNGIFA